MTNYLLDTNVLSEILKKRPEPRVVGRLRATAARSLFTSVVCVTELRYGSARHPQRGLWDRIAREALARIRIVPLGEAEAIRAGDLLAVLEANGTPIGIEDVFIGATALEGNLTVVTRNTKHFDRIPGLAVESWWR